MSTKFSKTEKLYQSSKPYKFKEMIHEECDKPAYLFLDTEYQAGDLTMASMFYKLDGSPTQPGDFIECQSCGKRIEIRISKEHGLIAI